MKHFSFKILLLCILLPPVLYILTFQLVEKKIQDVCTRDIEEIYIGDTQPLFEGSIAIEKAITQNINKYLKTNILLSWGAKANITVTTKRGTLLYPAIYREGQEPLTISPASRQVAEENYALLSEGLVVSVGLKLGHAHFLSIAILLIYILLAVAVFFLHYQSGLRKIAQEEAEKEEEIKRLGEQQMISTQRLERLNVEKETLLGELNSLKQRLNREKEKALKNEDDMIEEIMALEEKLKENLKLQQEQEDKIDTLIQKTEEFEKDERKSKKQRLKASESAQKRFSALYKNVSFHSKAFRGFASLTNELQLKAEEIILQLNDEPKLVSVKRKVFGRKNRETVFEIIFSYKGRLYYRNTKENKVEILSIGTKHTQSKDLDFLDNL
jgi:hypothetical protein